MFLLLNAASGVPLGVRASQRATPGSPTVLTLIPSPDPVVYMPGVSGDTVIWGGIGFDPTARGTVYMASLGQGRPRPHVLARAAAATPQLNDLRLSAHWASWIEYGPTRQWRLLAEDRRSRHRYVVDSATMEGGPALPAPYLPLSVLADDTLVWSVSVMPRHGSPWTGIRVRVLPKGATRLLTRETWPTCRATWPAIGGTMVAWDREGPCAGHNSDIVIADWRTGHTRALTHDHRSSEPTIADHHIAYKGASLRFGNGAIVLEDILTQRQRVVDNTGTAAVPMLSDHTLAWISGDTIVGLNLRTNRHYVLARDSSAAAPYATAYSLLGQGWQNEVVFVRASVANAGGPVRRWVVVARVP